MERIPFKKLKKKKNDREEDFHVLIFRSVYVHSNFLANNG